MSDILSLSAGESIWLPVLSGSMAPAVLPGDEVKIEIINNSELNSVLKPGVVAVFYGEGQFYFHRILFCTNFIRRVYQKGDANITGSWISKKRIIGIVENSRRKNKNNEFIYHSIVMKSKTMLPVVFKTIVKIVLRNTKWIVKRCLGID